MLLCGQTWNVQNGHILSELGAVAGSEVTGIVPLSVLKCVYVTGWFRYIGIYEMDSADVSYDVAVSQLPYACDVVLMLV